MSYTSKLDDGKELSTMAAYRLGFAVVLDHLIEPLDIKRSRTVGVRNANQVLTVQPISIYDPAL
jgi:hypothetical protein